MKTAHWVLRAAKESSGADGGLKGVQKGEHWTVVVSWLISTNNINIPLQTAIVVYAPVVRFALGRTLVVTTLYQFVNVCPPPLRYGIDDGIVV
jgi:hypothetical protein